MAKKPALTLVTLDNASTTLDLTDILAVVTSRAETRLHKELTEAKQAAKEAKQNVEVAKKAVKDLARAETIKAGQDLANKLAAVLGQYGASVTVPPLQHYWNGDLNDEGQMTIPVQVMGTGNGRDNTCTFVAFAEPSEELVAAKEFAETAESEQVRLQGEALDARKRLANVPMLERQARARIAETKLAATEDGQELLEVLTGELEADFLALPAN